MIQKIHSHRSAFLKTLFSITLLLVLVSISTVAQAQTAVPAPQNSTTLPPPQNTTVAPAVTPSQVIPSIQNPLKVNSIKDFMLSLVDAAISIGVVLAFFMFIYIGFKFVMARGNESKLAEAKSWFLYAVVGTAILISSKVIVDVITNTLTASGVVDPNLFK